MRQVAPHARVPYRAGMESALHGAGLPYGYSLVVWGSGALLIHDRGKPSVGLIFLFVAGAVAAYGLLKVAGHGASGATGLQLAGSPHVLRAGVVHVAAVGSALGAVALIGLIASGVVWPLGSFAATLLYLGITAVELALREGQEGEDAN